MEKIVKVVGLWELGWSAPITESNLWMYPLRDLGVNEWIMCPVSGIDEPAVKEYKDIPAVIEANPDLTVVYLDEKAETSLSDFVHPDKALYVLGKAGISPLIAYKREQDVSVKIETCANLGLLWPHQAVSIVLYDRFKKMGN